MTGLSDMQQPQLLAQCQHEVNNRAETDAVLYLHAASSMAHYIVMQYASHIAIASSISRAELWILRHNSVVMQYTGLSQWLSLKIILNRLTANHQQNITSSKPAMLAIHFIQLPCWTE